VGQALELLDNGVLAEAPEETVATAEAEAGGGRETGTSFVPKAILVRLLLCDVLVPREAVAVTIPGCQWIQCRYEWKAPR
jgi:hypothetical protein